MIEKTPLGYVDSPVACADPMACSDSGAGADHMACAVSHGLR